MVTKTSQADEAAYEIMYEPEDYSTVYTAEKVASMLDIAAPRIVHNWIRDGKLRAKKIGRRWFITKAEFKRFVAPGADLE